MIRQGDRDERTVAVGDRRIGILGPFSSSLTLAWMATHRDRLRALLLGGKRLSVLVTWDRRGAERVEHSDAEVDALHTIVYGYPPRRGDDYARERLSGIAAVLDRGIPDERKLAVITRLVHDAP